MNTKPAKPPAFVIAEKSHVRQFAKKSDFLGNRFANSKLDYILVK